MPAKTYLRAGVSVEGLEPSGDVAKRVVSAEPLVISSSVLWCSRRSGRAVCIPEKGDVYYVIHKSDHQNITQTVYNTQERFQQTRNTAPSLHSRLILDVLIQRDRYWQPQTTCISLIASLLIFLSMSSPVSYRRLLVSLS